GSTSSSIAPQDNTGIAARSWIVIFDRNRKVMEKYVAGLPEGAALRFKPTINWMRQVIAKEAPELLTE
ncbi:MAG: hypothetical protein ACXAB4_09360, partial [Candidatus Hodarchaeales archaeon]